MIQKTMAGLQVSFIYFIHSLKSWLGGWHHLFGLRDMAILLGPSLARSGCLSHSRRQANRCVGLEHVVVFRWISLVGKICQFIQSPGIWTPEGRKEGQLGSLEGCSAVTRINPLDCE